MATKKTTEDKKTTTTTAAKETAKAAPAKTTAKTTTAAKTTAAKAEAKPATKTTAAKAKTEEKAAPAKKTTTRKAVEAKVYIEFNGAKVAVDEVIENVKATYKANGGNDSIKTLDIYVKPEESAAYFVVNGEIEGNKMDVYFC